MVVGARQNFAEKQPGLSEVIELCLNLSDGFCITCLVLSNSKTITL